jgi:hypothetical protein
MFLIRHFDTVLMRLSYRYACDRFDITPTQLDTSRAFLCSPVPIGVRLSMRHLQRNRTGVPDAVRHGAPVSV